MTMLIEKRHKNDMTLSRKMLFGTVAASSGIFVAGILGAASPESDYGVLVEVPSVFLLSVMVFFMHLFALFLSRRRVRRMPLSALLVSSALCPWLSMPIIDKSTTFVDIFLIPNELVEDPMLVIATIGAYVIVTILTIIATAKIVSYVKRRKDATSVPLHGLHLPYRLLLAIGNVVPMLLRSDPALLELKDESAAQRL